MIKKISIIVVVLLVVIQLIPTHKNNADTPEVTAFVEETKPSKKVQGVLEAKCFDCHTNKTTYPWYANVAPLSFWINHHVEEGKEHLSFSEWPHYEAKRKKHKLHELIEEVEEGEMPLKSYKILHGDLSPAESQLLIEWAKNAISQY